MILLLLKEKQSCERSTFRYFLQLCFVTIYKSRQTFGIIVQNSDKQAIFLTLP